MKILSINCSHHASICVVDKGEITFYLESQRVDRKKYSNNIESAFVYLKDKEFDWCLYSGYENDKVSVEEYSRQINNIKNKYNLSWKNESFVNHHHLNHAACAFYNSGFKEAYCIVADGGGIPHYVKNKILGREILSIYKLSHPDKYELIHQVCANTYGKSFVENNQVSENTLSLGQLFDIVKNTFKSKEPGGVMALSAYGKRNKFINRILKINKNSFTTNTNTIYRMLSYTKKNNINFTKENISYRVQKDCESIIKFYIKKILKEEPNANICLSGGFFQNCVANYEFLKISSNIYVDPWSHDGGTSIGAAVMWYYICTKDKNIRKLKNIYLGPEHEIKEFKKINVKIIDEDSWPTESVLTNKITDFKEVAKLLANKNIVAMFQGRSEAGPRALGNRSLLYDARDPKAKEVINLIKKREWYRPYAGTILLEHANDWFDLRGKKETQFMSYALKVKKEKTDIIPGILHIDNTSRMQTLKYEDNHNYYNLLKEFYNLTNVPMLLNTSLNVAGEPLVETLQEAISFINNTNVNYLYLPEKNYLLIKNER